MIRHITLSTYSAEQKEILDSNESIESTAKYIYESQTSALNYFTPLGSIADASYIEVHLKNALLQKNIMVNQIRSEYLTKLLLSDFKYQYLDYNEAERTENQNILYGRSSNTIVRSLFVVPFSIFYATALKNDVVEVNQETAKFAQPGRCYTIREKNF